MEDFIGLKPSSYHSKKNIALFNSIVCHDIDVFRKSILWLIQDMEPLSQDANAKRVICGGGESKHQCCVFVTYEKCPYRVIEIVGGSSSSIHTVFPIVFSSYKLFSW